MKWVNTNSNIGDIHKDLKEGTSVSSLPRGPPATHFCCLLTAFGVTVVEPELLVNRATTAVGGWKKQSQESHIVRTTESRLSSEGNTKLLRSVTNFLQKPLKTQRHG